MTLDVARRRAELIVEWLSPFCERIEIAGSIRRRRPLCNDIDVVVIPKFRERERKVDMFATEKARVNLLREHLVQYVGGMMEVKAGGEKAFWKGRTGQPGPEPKEDAKNLLLITRTGVQLDVWCAAPESWFTLLICRTGSARHNIWAAQRAEQLRGHWNPYEGLRIRGEAIPLASEEDFYAALNVPFLRPDNGDRENPTWATANLAQRRGDAEVGR